MTNPAKPKELGRFPTGVVTGVHEVGHRPAARRPLALAAVPYSFNLSQGRRGDLRIIDITDPRRPREVADWDVRRDGPAETRGQLAARRDVFAHSAWPFDKGNKFGLLLVDRRAVPGHQRPGRAPADRPDPLPTRGRLPRRPLGLVQRGRDPVRPERRGHAGGRQRVAEELDLPAGVRHQLAGAAEAAVDLRHRVGRAGNDGQVATDGVYSVHNAVIEGDLGASWYSDGVRVVDLSDPRRPREIASFVSHALLAPPVRGHRPAAAATCPWSGASSPGRTWSWPAT